MQASCAMVLVIFAGCCSLAQAATHCPGAIQVEGYGKVTPVNAQWDTPGQLTTDVDIVSELGMIVPNLKGRTYFADSCWGDGSYHPSRYSAFSLLNKTLRWTTDLDGAGCGCNAAFYLTSLHQSANVSGCYDYYCDANSVCNVPCAEIDLQEANMHAWHSTLHVLDDGAGIATGFGGGGKDDNGPRQWTKEEYGPLAKCIQTTSPFQVAISFPVDATGRLQAMVTELSQPGRPCNLTAVVAAEGYWHKGRDGMAELTEALRAGMTPIVSYWKSSNMLWLDGRGPDSLGPCEHDVPEDCASSVQFFDFAVEPVAPTAVAAQKAASPGDRRLQTFV